MLSSYWESVAIFTGINCLMGISLYIPMMAGLISLGQGGFMAIGAYVCALLTKAGVPFGLALAAGGAAAAVAGVVVGTPALRIRGIYVMILTLGFGEIVRVFFATFEPTGGASGMGGIRPLTELWQVTVVTAAALLLVWRIRHVRFGRAMIAIHEDDVAAEAMGINLTRTKLLSFTLGALIAGVAGGFYAHQALFIDANQFDFMRSAVTFLYVILGGVGNPFGPIVGAVIVTLLPELLRVVQDWRMTIFGTILVIMAIWRPDGLLPGLRTRRT
jgi:branched-chain amino acid transport system permease protein